MTTMTTLATNFDALEGLFFAITPDPDFLNGFGWTHSGAGGPRRGAASSALSEDQADDIPFLPLHDRWSF